MTFNTKVKGTVCGIVAAISYGTNPLGALSLYHDGMNALSVLFYRYGLATLILGFMLMAQRRSLALTRREAAIVGLLGILFEMSSFCLYHSFNFMDAGIASTILFVYPVMVAVIMAVCFKERITPMTVLSILLALAGIGLLYKGGDGVTLNAMGVMLVILSSLTYAVYIVVVNKSAIRLSAVKLSFYVMLVGTLAIVVQSACSGKGYELQWLTTPEQWMYALLLALLPTVISLVLMVIAVHDIGSTPTAIMGALEPVTAVIIGVCVFGEAFTARLALGIALILAAVMLIIVGKSLSPASLITVFHRFGRMLTKTWRWKS